jgi:hypothetical protein
MVHATVLRAGPRPTFLGLTTCGLGDRRMILGGNLDSVFHCCRAAAPYLEKQGGAKAAVMALTRQLAVVASGRLEKVFALAARSGGLDGVTPFFDSGP